jgi:hypothetical protein
MFARTVYKARALISGTTIVVCHWWSRDTYEVNMRGVLFSKLTKKELTYMINYM